MKSLSILVAVFVLVQSEIDERYIDESVDPCDDFHAFACGNFKNYNQRPEGKDSWDLFSITERDLTLIGKDILASPKRKDDPISLKKVKSAYKACVNVEKVENFTYYEAPEKKIIEEYGGMPLFTGTSDQLSWTQIGQLAGKFGIHQLFQFTIKNFDPTTYIIIMVPDSFDTPQLIRPETVKTYDEVLEESLKKFVKRTKILKGEDPLGVFLWKSVKYFNSMFGDLKTDLSLQKDLDDMQKFMTKLYSDSSDNVNDMIPLSMVVTLKDLQDWTFQQFGDKVDINWINFLNSHFKGAGLNITEDFVLYLTDPTKVYEILDLVRTTDPKVVKNFVLLKTFLYMSPDSHSVMREAFKEYYNSLGLEFYDRSEYCTRKLLDVVDSASLSFAVANDFINYHFNLNKIPQAVRVINYTTEAFKTLLPTFDWLDDESRNIVVQKLNNIVIDLAFPEFVEDKNSLDHFYENVEICESDHYGNSQRIRAFKQAYSFSLFEHHDIWTRSPFLVNAYALRASNSIFSPVSLLQPSYFKGNDLVFDYSRFGTIISHELIHHFDSAGITYDQNGDQNDLLSNSTGQAFQEKLQCYIDHYNQYYIEEISQYVNGTKTLNENLADISGTRHAFLAFTKALQGEIVKDSTSKYNLLQQFFINYATGWCSDDSPAYLKKIVSSDSHSPNRVRILGTLSNLEEFSEAFGCPAGSRMNPDVKCSTW